MPPDSDGALKPPSEPLTVLTSSPVPLFLIFTLAPGITPPDVSTTMPLREEKKLPCANAGTLTARVRAAARTSRMTLIYRSLLKTNRAFKSIKEATNVSGCLIEVNHDLAGSERRPRVFSADPANRSAWRSAGVSNRGRASGPKANGAYVLFGFFAVRPGTRFDVTTAGSRRINGVRNIRQAL